MQTIDTIVAAADGERRAARVLVCDCGSQTFHAFVLCGQTRPHLQCVDCGDVYCTHEGCCEDGAGHA